MPKKIFPKKYSDNQKEPIYNGNDYNKNRPKNEKTSKSLFTASTNISYSGNYNNYLEYIIYDLIYKYTNLQDTNINWEPNINFFNEILSNSNSQGKILNDYFEKLKKLNISKSEFINTINIINGETNAIRARNIFAQLIKSDKIKLDEKVVPWCPHCYTNLIENELIVQETNIKNYYLKYFIEGKGDSILIMTSNIASIFGDVAILVNPKDKRYKKLIGKNVLIPLINKQIPIITENDIIMGIGTGAKNISPAHNVQDYHRALRHNLPIHNYAYDYHGKFTKLANKFASKSVSEVLENILQFLEDIGNIEKIEFQNKKVFACPYCHSSVFNILTKQWFWNNITPIGGLLNNPINTNNIHISISDKMNNYINNGNIVFFPSEKNNKFIYNFNISKSSNIGIPIPIGYCNKCTSTLFEEDKIFPINDNINDNTNNNKFQIWGQIIFNLIINNYLNNPFSLENLINILYSTSIDDTSKSKFEIYINYYLNKFHNYPSLIKELKNMLKQSLIINNDISTIIKKGGFLVDILEQIPQIEKKGNLYQLQFKCSSCDNNIHYLDKNYFTQHFLEAVNYYHKNYSNIIWYLNSRSTNIILNLFQIIDPQDNLNLNWQIYLNKLNFFDNNNYIQDIGKELFNYSNKYPNEILRLAILFLLPQEINFGTKYNLSGSFSNEILFEESNKLSALHIGSPKSNELNLQSEISHSNNFINKFWNFVRYIDQNIIANNQNIPKNYKKLAKIISEIESLSEFDLWILDKLNQLIIISTDNIKHYNFMNILYFTIQFIEVDLSEIYLEIYKFQKSKFTEIILLYIVFTLLKLLYPFIPSVTLQLRELLELEGSLYQHPFPNTINNIQTPFKTKLLIDIINIFQKLKIKSKIKNHEKIDIYLQANSSYTEYFNKYYDLISQILKINNYYNLNNLSNFIPEEFIYAEIFDLKLGIRATQNINKQNILNSLLYDLDKQKQYLQNLRNLISSENNINKLSPQDFADKTQKINDIKKQIILIEHKINELKMKKK